MIGTTLTLVLVAGVLAAFAAFGIWCARHATMTTEDFLTARDTTGGPSLAATVVASSMGAWILLSPVEAGAAFGGITAVLGYAVGSALPLLGYAIVGPQVRRLMPDGHSITEYAHARYGPAMGTYVLAISALYMAVFLAAEMTGIAAALDAIAGIPPWQTAALVGGVALAYTAYGGLRASILTDTVQAALILPLLAITALAAVLALGGPVTVFERVSTAQPALVTLGFLPGLQFGAYVAIAVLGAEALNQAWWQRIYAADSERSIRRGFLLAGIAVIPIVLISGLFGVVATGLGMLDDAAASTAFFVVIDSTLAAPLVFGVAILATLLVTSSADTLFNAIASLVTTALRRLDDNPEDGRLLRIARVTTVVVAVGAVYIGSQGYSVLTLFLTADLLAAATFIPLYAGLYTRRLSGQVALVGALAGLAVGATFFPPFGILDGTYLEAFAGSVIVSTAIVVAGTALAGSPKSELMLDDDVTQFDDAP